MKITEINPPRIFKVRTVEIRHCAYIELEPDEQVTFVTSNGKEYDVVCKNWGYYATPSLNGRLKRFGLRAVLVKNPNNKIFLRLVEEGKEDIFHSYVDSENETIVCWLDDDSTVEHFLHQLI